MIHQPATSLLELLASGKVSAVELTQAFLDRIDKQDPGVGAFLSVAREDALGQAREVDQHRKQGKTLGKLAGLPVAIKDVLCTRGRPTTCGWRMLEHFAPPYDATVVRRLKEADAILLGKTNMDEFAMGSSTENSALAATRNPWNLEHVPGGSSGGAAACVAASMAPLSIGTDTGGSIRQPAAFCGVVGLKPTYGRVSRYGLIAFASSLDQVGPLARTAEDTALLLDVIAGHDPRDSTSAPTPSPQLTPLHRRPLRGVRLGIVEEHFGDGLDDQVAAAVKEAVRVYESLGAEIVPLKLPHNKYAIATYYIIAPSEASSNLARYDGVHYGYRTDEGEMLQELAAENRRLRDSGASDEALDELDSPLVRMYRRTRAEGFGPEVKRRVMLGAYALSAGYYDAFYLKALKVRRLIRQDYDDAFRRVEGLIGPVTPTAAFPAGEKVDDPLAMYLSDLYTVGANLAGIPGISLPCGFTSAGLPIGLQIQGPPFSEAKLLEFAAAFQAETDLARAEARVAISDLPYDVVIGLEVHVQLDTATKLFCRCSTQFGAPPNTQVCPVCLGMPGSLPVMNRQAFQLALKVGLALNCQIPKLTKWDRKQYYYPDLPKGYQISQYDQPLAGHGWLEISDAKDRFATKRIGIIRAHLEEDAGKSMHDEAAGRADSRIDLNRTGTPLLEIVSEPDMRSPLEAQAFLNELKLLLTYLEVSDCNMQEGSLRVDANINLHVQSSMGTIATPIVEVKNMNSFRAVERALDYEARRQFDAWQATGMVLGQAPKQTRGWDDQAQVTKAQRGKEESSDYRYFPDPDLTPVVVSDADLEAARQGLGELPGQVRSRLLDEYELSAYDADVIANQGRAVVDYYESLAKASGDSKRASVWLQQFVFAVLNERAVEIDQFPIASQHLAEVIRMVAQGELDNTRGKDVFADMLESGRTAADSAKALGIRQVDDQELRALCQELLDANPQVVRDVQDGKGKAVGALIGQAKKRNPNVNPNEFRQLCLDIIQRVEPDSS